jgi:hypothetical protein
VDDSCSHLARACATTDAVAILHRQHRVCMEQAQQVTGQEGIAPGQRGTLPEAGKNLIRVQVKGVPV